MKSTQHLAEPFAARMTSMSPMGMMGFHEQNDADHVGATPDHKRQHGES